MNDSVITKHREVNAERFLVRQPLPRCPVVLLAAVFLPRLPRVLPLSAARDEGILLAVPYERRGLLYPVDPRSPDMHRVPDLGKLFSCLRTFGSFPFLFLCIQFSPGFSLCPLPS